MLRAFSHFLPSACRNRPTRRTFYLATSAQEGDPAFSGRFWDLSSCKTPYFTLYAPIEQRKAAKHLPRTGGFHHLYQLCVKPEALPIHVRQNRAACPCAPSPGIPHRLCHTFPAKRRTAPGSPRLAARFVLSHYSLSFAHWRQRPMRAPSSPSRSSHANDCKRRQAKSPHTPQCSCPRPSQQPLTGHLPHGGADCAIHPVQLPA